MSMLENLKLKESYEIVFDNPSITEGMKYKLMRRRKDLADVLSKHMLMNYVLGLPTKKDISELIPEVIDIYDLRYSRDEFKKYLEEIGTIREKKRIELLIQENVEELISNYDKDKSFYIKFCTRNHDNNGLSKVWVNSLCTLFLVKWAKYNKFNEQTKGYKKFSEVVNSALKWIMNNRIEYKNLFLYYRQAGNIEEKSYPIKIYETSLALQTMVRAFQDEPFRMDINLDSTINEILEFKDSKDTYGTRLTYWPSDMAFDKNDLHEIREDRNQIGNAGATSYTIQFLSEVISSGTSTITKDSKQAKLVEDAIVRAVLWLVSEQVEGCGYWFKHDKNEPSIEQTCEALQALLKYNYLIEKKHIDLRNVIKDKEKILHWNERVKESVLSGLKWLSENFCIEESEGKSIIYAWPSDATIKEKLKKPCCRNTAFVTSTLLKADTNPESFVVAKPVMWLINVHPENNFDNIYKYCALLDYLKFSSPSGD